jgi:hypothetical protein
VIADATLVRPPGSQKPPTTDSGGASGNVIRRFSVAQIAIAAHLTHPKPTAVNILTIVAPSSVPAATQSRYADRYGIGHFYRRAKRRTLGTLSVCLTLTLM